MAIAPWVFTSNSGLTLLSQMGIAILICQSYQLLLGQGGMLSFGHAVYVGAGTYLSIQTLRLMGLEEVWFPVSAVPLLGGLGGLTLAALLGWFTTRRSGTPLAMISLGLGELVWALALRWPEAFGGDGGLTANRVQGPSVWGITLGPTLEMYGLIAGYTLAGSLLLAGFVQTPLGRLLNAVRDNAERVAFLGYDPHLVRYLAFMLSGFLAGVAGGLGALTHEIFTTDMLSAERSGSYLLFTVLGGSSLFAGPVIGGVLMVLSMSMLSTYTPAWMLYLGILLMAVVLWVPGGLSAGLRRTWDAMAGAMGWRQALVRALLALAWAWMVAGFMVGVEMGYHLQQVSVRGADLVRWGLAWNVHALSAWTLAGLMVLTGAGLALSLRRWLHAASRSETSP